MSKLDLSEFEDEPWMFENGLCALGDEHFMRRALELANQAAVQDEVPVGAIVVHENKIIATAYNQREQLADPTAHAEMIAITKLLRIWALGDCSIALCL